MKRLLVGLLTAVMVVAGMDLYTCEVHAAGKIIIEVPDEDDETETIEQSRQEEEVNPAEDKKEEEVNPTEDKKEEVVNPTEDKKEEVVNPTEDKKEEVVNPAGDKKEEETKQAEDKKEEETKSTEDKKEEQKTETTQSKEQKNTEAVKQTYQVRTTTGNVEIEGVYRDDKTAEFMQLVNDYRVKNGLDALPTNDTMTQIARDRAIQCVVRFDHTLPFATHTSACDYYDVLAENIATGSDSMTVLFDALKASSGHNANMLSDYSCGGYFPAITGVAVFERVVGRQMLYFLVQVFNTDLVF